MYFFDINCMIGQWGQEDLRFHTADALLVQMDRLGIQRSLVFDSKSWQCDLHTGNASIVAETQDSARLLPVPVLSPLIDREFGGRERLLQWLQTSRAAAVRLFPVDQNYTLYPWNISKLFSLMNDIRMPVLIECRQQRGSMSVWFNQIHAIATSYPETPVILLTVGYRSLRILYELFAACPNLYIDTSTFITYRGIEETVELYGSERLLFGTRMPFLEGGVAVGRLIYADISLEHKQNIAHANLERLLADCLLPARMSMEVN